MNVLYSIFQKEKMVVRLMLIHVILPNVKYVVTDITFILKGIIFECEFSLVPASDEGL